LALQVGRDEVVKLLLQVVLLGILELEVSEYPAFPLPLVLKAVLVPEAAGLVEVGQLAVKLEEELQVAEDVEVDELLELVFLLDVEALGDLVLPQHVLVGHVEGDESAEEDRQLVEHHLPPLPFGVGDLHPQVAARVDRPDRKADSVELPVPDVQPEEVQDGVEGDDG
jgi:hypothetical protein